MRKLNLVLASIILQKIIISIPAITVNRYFKEDAVINFLLFFFFFAESEKQITGRCGFAKC